MHAQHLIQAALDAAPRRFRMPPLPAGLAQAGAAELDTALAFAIEAARCAHEASEAPAAAVGALFTRRLAELVAVALAPDTGDAAFQALLLRTEAPEVREHVQLATRQQADRRAVRAALDPWAHPARLQARPPAAWDAALAALRQLEQAAEWEGLAASLAALLASGELPIEGPLREALARIAQGDALAALVRGQALSRTEAVRQYRALYERLGPAAATVAAAAQGRAAARAGIAAEHSVTEALREVAAMIDGATAATGGPCRAVQRLRMPRGFPGEASGAKDEWDAALLRGDELLLLVEVKAAPSAATGDLSRLLRGLQRLALADGGGSFAFGSLDGVVTVSGTSLGTLRPADRALPPHVIYACPAAHEAEVPMLSAGSKAVLLAEPASLAYARALRDGAADPAMLLPVWEALAGAQPRLRAALYQYDSAVRVREAMLHPQDLLAGAASAIRPP